MSVKRWQQILALLPCERCWWMPPDCTCVVRVGKSSRPKSKPAPKTKQLPILTLDERRAAYSRLDVPVLDVIAAAAAEHQEGAA